MPRLHEPRQPGARNRPRLRRLQGPPAPLYVVRDEMGDRGNPDQRGRLSSEGSALEGGGQAEQRTPHVHPLWPALHGRRIPAARAVQPRARIFPDAGPRQPSEPAAHRPRVGAAGTGYLHRMRRLLLDHHSLSQCLSGQARRIGMLLSTTVKER